MRNLIAFLLLASTAAHAVTTDPVSVVPNASSEFSQNRQMGPVALKYSLGTQVKQAHNTAVGVFDVATSGGATGYHNVGITLPAKSVIRKVWFDVVTAPTTAAPAAFIAFKATTDGDLKDSVGTGLWANRVDGELDGTVTEYLKLSTATVIKASVLTAALTAGKIKIFVDYVVSE
jgi:hypothetical protein